MSAPSYANASARCGSCSAVLYEGEAVQYDKQSEQYFCDSVCAEEWYAEYVSEYMRKHLRSVDL